MNRVGEAPAVVGDPRGRPIAFETKPALTYPVFAIAKTRGSEESKQKRGGTLLRLHPLS